MTSKRKKGKQGMASCDKETRRRVASMGGKASQASGKAHKFTSETGRAAGKKGLKSQMTNGTGHRFTSETAALAARKGWKKRQ